MRDKFFPSVFTVVFIFVMLLGLLACSNVAEAHDRSYRHNHHSEYYRHYHHNDHRRRKSDNDDWAWAVGGLILGAAIANSQNEKQQQTQSGLPPPQRRVQTCYDEVAYDAQNKPYVLRRCFETVE